MQLAHQAQGQRQALEPAQTVLHGRDVIGHFAEVFGAPIHCRSRLRGEQFSERRLRALDFARQHRFAREEGADEEVRVGQAPALPWQPANEPVGVGEGPDEGAAPRDRRRERIGHECPVAVDWVPVSRRVQGGHRRISETQISRNHYCRSS